MANQQFVRDSPNGPFTQEYLYYQPRNIERTVIDTRAGDDEVHGDPGYRFPGTESEWGIAPGDLEQRGLISALDIRGGTGNDRLFGGAYDDVLDGGPGWTSFWAARATTGSRAATATISSAGRASRRCPAI